MSAYTEVDPIILKWVEALGSKLFDEWAGAPARFFYTPGDPPFECFQISVEPPQDGLTTVWARAIDTNDDVESKLVQSWVTPVDELDAVLGQAVETVAEWKARPRKKPDPPSPW